MGKGSIYGCVSCFKVSRWSYGLLAYGFYRLSHHYVSGDEENICPFQPAILAFAGLFFGVGADLLVTPISGISSRVPETTLSNSLPYPSHPTDFLSVLDTYPAHRWIEKTKSGGGRFYLC